MPAGCSIGNGSVVTVGGVLAGGPSHGTAGLVALPGIGATAAKSVALSSVSTQPPEARAAAVVLDNCGAGAPSEKLAVP